jgi:hypothetical protein
LAKDRVWSILEVWCLISCSFQIECRYVDLVLIGLLSTIPYSVTESNAYRASKTPLPCLHPFHFFFRMLDLDYYYSVAIVSRISTSPLTTHYHIESSTHQYQHIWLVSHPFLRSSVPPSILPVWTPRFGSSADHLLHLTQSHLTVLSLHTCTINHARSTWNHLFNLHTK